MRFAYSGKRYTEDAQRDLKLLAKCLILQLVQVMDDGSAGGKISGWESWDLLGQLPPAVSHFYVAGLSLTSAYILKSHRDPAVAPALRFIQLVKIVGGGVRGVGGVQRTVREMTEIDQAAEARGLSVVWADCA